MKKYKRLRWVMRGISIGGWTGCFVLAMMSDANSIGFFPLVVFSILLVFIALISGIASAELTETIKLQSKKLHGDYRRYGDDNDVA